MATSSFDVNFRIETEEDAQVFIEALEKSLSNPVSETPEVQRYNGDLSEVNKEILRRYGKLR